MTDRGRMMLRAYMLAQQALDTNSMLKPAVVRHLMDEIIRQRRIIEAQERRIRRLEREDERVQVHGERDPQGTAEGSGDDVREQGSDVDSEHG